MFSRLLLLQAQVLLRLFLKVKMLECLEDFVEDPDRVHPPGPADPEDCERNCERKDDELGEEVDGGLEIRHVDQLEVTKIGLAPGEYLGPEEGRGLEHPAVCADP